MMIRTARQANRPGVLGLILLLWHWIVLVASGPPLMLLDPELFKTLR